MVTTTETPDPTESLHEVLRSAAIALQGRPVALWEVHEGGAVRPIATSPGRVLPPTAVREMNAWALLESRKSPSRAQIVEQMDDILCRCGAHQRILAAIEEVAKRPGGVK